MNVDLLAELMGERHGKFDRLLPVLPRQLEMRNTAHDVSAQLDRLTHQSLAVGKGLDALLRKGHQLESDLIREFLLQLGERPQRGQLRIADVDVAPDEQDAIGDLPAQHPRHALLDVRNGEVLDALAPDRDPFEERTAEVLAGLADGQDGVEVDVGLDQGGREQVAARVDHLAGAGRLRASGCGDDPVALDRHARQGGRAGQPGVSDQQVEHGRSVNRSAGQSVTDALKFSPKLATAESWGMGRDCGYNH
jgi:hypothetical protein